MCIVTDANLVAKENTCLENISPPHLRLVRIKGRLPLTILLEGHVLSSKITRQMCVVVDTNKN